MSIAAGARRLASRSADARNPGLLLPPRRVLLGVIADRAVLPRWMSYSSYMGRHDTGQHPLDTLRDISASPARSTRRVVPLLRSDRAR